MEIYHSIWDCKMEKSVAALGKFDGVHLGHQAIIEELKRQKAADVKTVVITFFGSPQSVLFQKNSRYLMTEEEKEQYFAKLGIDCLISIHLDEDFLNIEALDFVKNCLVKRLGIQSVVCGSDFYFGKGRKGDAQFLKEIGEKLGFSVSVVKPVCLLETEQISSTGIREYIRNGNMEMANQMLGHAFVVSGPVTSGAQIGRTIQFPTVNLIPPEEKILPPNGVYASRTFVEGNYYDSITNIGVKPTVSGKHQVGVETNIFDFEKSVYGQKIEVELLHYVRAERKFHSVEELREQIRKDVQLVKNGKKA